MVRLLFSFGFLGKVGEWLYFWR